MIEVEQEFDMTNMQIRGEAVGKTTLSFKLEPNDGRIVIIDAINRNESYKFEYQISSCIKDIKGKVDGIRFHKSEEPPILNKNNWLSQIASKF